MGPARVFISCGQAKGTGEEIIARRIAEELKNEGYEPYVATQEQTPRGLTENIFAKLRDWEYFVFVDFKREELSGTGFHRGSLFSHQELAIAAFAKLDVIVLEETGVKTRDGMSGALQLNAETFTDRHHLPTIIAGLARKRPWNPHWRNALALERVPNEYTEAPISSPSRRYFHIGVRNKHREKLATNCFVYLEKVIQLPNRESLPIKTVEFKWAGTTLTAVAIAAGTTRDFDAFVLHHQNPTEIQFSALTDSDHYLPTIPVGAGDYQFTYIVRSENFPPARGTFTLSLKSQLSDTTFK
jgi:hypothetical protein